MSHCACHMLNAYVDPWDMLNNFCFHVYAQKVTVYSNAFLGPPPPVSLEFIELVPS